MAKKNLNNKNSHSNKGRGNGSAKRKQGTPAPIIGIPIDDPVNKARISGIQNQEPVKHKNSKSSKVSQLTPDFPSVKKSNVKVNPKVNPNGSVAMKAPVKPVEVPKLKLEFRNTEWRSNIPLILFMFLIVVFGLIILYSVSAPVGYINSKFTSSAFFAMSQLKYSVVGVILALILNFIPIDFFKKKVFMFLAYGTSLALIAATAVIGIERQGARRWIKLGGTEFQTSEIFKIGLVIALAMYRLTIVHLKEHGKLKPKDPKNATIFYAFFEIILPAGLFLLPATLVLVQPHFSCFLILGVVTAACFLVSGINIKSWIVGVGTLILAAAIGFGIVMLVPTAREKITDKINSNFAHVFKRFSIYNQDEEEELTEQQKDEALQVTRAKDAIGSGGLKGVGLGYSRSKYSYVSESHNDYIFSIFVEETGFIGGVVLILSYLAFLFMGFRVAIRAKDVFCRIIATGYTTLIVLEAMWNIGVELTVLPSTGITLPFFSYGGTAQILLLLAFGMVLCVARSGVVYEKKDGNK